MKYRSHCETPSVRAVPYESGQQGMSGEGSAALLRKRMPCWLTGLGAVAASGTGDLDNRQRYLGIWIRTAESQAGGRAPPCRAHVSRILYT